MSAVGRYLRPFVHVRVCLRLVRGRAGYVLILSHGAAVFRCKQTLMPMLALRRVHVRDLAARLSLDRCNLALMLIQDVVVDGLESPSLVWPLHVPFMLHIIFLGLDNARPLVHENCKELHTARARGGSSVVGCSVV